jgi:transposase
MRCHRPAGVHGRHWRLHRCSWFASDFVTQIGVSIRQHPTGSPTLLGGSDHVRARPCRPPLEAVVVALEKYEIWLQLVRQEVTIAEAAAAQHVDRSTIMRIRTVAKEGALAALAASKPGVAAFFKNRRAAAASRLWHQHIDDLPELANRSVDVPPLTGHLHVRLVRPSAITHRVSTWPSRLGQQRRESAGPTGKASVVHFNPPLDSNSSNRGKDRPKRRYQRTARTITSRGNRNPSNAEARATGTWARRTSSPSQSHRTHHASRNATDPSEVRQRPGQRDAAQAARSAATICS